MTEKTQIAIGILITLAMLCASGVSIQACFVFSKEKMINREKTFTVLSIIFLMLCVLTFFLTLLVAMKIGEV